MTTRVSPEPPWVVVAGGLHERGAMDKANAALVRYLRRRDVPVHAVAHEVEPALGDDPGVTVHRVERPGGMSALSDLALDRIGRRVSQTLVARFPGTRVVVNGGNCHWPDVCWLHCVHDAWRACDRGAPTWFRAKNAILKRWARSRERRIAAGARVVIANSHRTCRDAIERLAVDPVRAHTVYLGAGPEQRPPIAPERHAARMHLGLDPAAPVVAFLAPVGFDRNKGFDVLWNAWKRVCARPDWDAVLCVAGGGSAAPMVQAEALSLGLQERVLFLGFTERVPEILRAADVLVSPARYEAYGLSVHEALCFGVPSIVSSRAGIAERFPLELRDMLLDDPTDVAELEARLLAWWVARDDWTQRVASFSAELRARSWDDMAAEMVSIIESHPTSAPASRHALTA